MDKLKKITIYANDFGKKLNCNIITREILEDRYDLIIKFGIGNNEYFVLNELDIKKLFNIDKDIRLYLIHYTLGDFFKPFKRCEFGIYYYKILK